MGPPIKIRPKYEKRKKEPREVQARQATPPNYSQQPQQNILKLIVLPEYVDTFQRIFPGTGFWEGGQFKYFSHPDDIQFYQRELEKGMRLQPQTPQYQQPPPARRVAPQQPAYYPYPNYQQQPAYPQQPQPPRKIMSRRTFLALLVGAGIGAAAAAAASFIPRPPEQAGGDARDYEGTVAMMAKADAQGDLFYYEDLCHTGDEGLGGSGRGHILTIGLNRDRDFQCTRTQGMKMGDSAHFSMLSAESYPIESGPKEELTGEEIFKKAILGRKAIFRKGKVIDTELKAWWLERVIEL